MRIGELAEEVGVNPKTIRFYEEIGLLPEPRRRPSGYRDYGEKDRDRLVFVRTAQRLGIALSGIKEILAFRERGEAPCGYVREVLARQTDELDGRIAELVALRDQLRALQDQADDLPAEEGSYCAVIEHAEAMAEAKRDGPPAPEKEEEPSCPSPSTVTRSPAWRRRKGPRWWRCCREPSTTGPTWPAPPTCG